MKSCERGLTLDRNSSSIQISPFCVSWIMEAIEGRGFLMSTEDQQHSAHIHPSKKLSFTVREQYNLTRTHKSKTQFLVPNFCDTEILRPWDNELLSLWDWYYDTETLSWDYWTLRHRSLKHWDSEILRRKWKVTVCENRWKNLIFLMLGWRVSK